MLPRMYPRETSRSCSMMEMNVSPQHLRAEAPPRRMLPDPEQIARSRHMLHQKVCRSPRNSLVPIDYYRGQQNGGRSTRSSLNLDTGPPVEKVHGSRNSLVPEAALSPRNSVIPCIHNRSPRNSIAPLNGSRSSLASENGTTPPVRSPRHSLTPNSSRSPRCSVTNIEMIDRSPQRSPRGSIIPEYVNQSPRNSVTHYEHVNRSSRRSIETNDTSRGSTRADEDETSSPRHSIEANVIDTTPRRSLGGIQERRFTRASLLQHARRASDDQGFRGRRNSSPYRRREFNGVYMRGATVIQTDQGYGTTVHEEPRRASSSVSQFSGDESRQLFTYSERMRERARNNEKTGVITYGSVVFQLKDADLESENTCDFVLRGLKVVCKTRIVTAALSLLFALPVLMLIFGWKFYNLCPLEPGIPIYMIIGGVFGILMMGLLIYVQIHSRKPDLANTAASPEISLPKVFAILFACFLSGWFVIGNKWILRIWWPPDKPPMMDPDIFCREALYIFSVVHLGVVYLVIATALLTILILASFRALACPFAERFR